MYTLITLLVLSSCVAGGYITFPPKNRRPYYAVVFGVMLVGFVCLPLWSTAGVCEAFFIGMLLRLISIAQPQQLFRYHVTKTVWFFVHWAPQAYRQETKSYFQAQFGIFGIYKEK